MKFEENGKKYSEETKRKRYKKKDYIDMLKYFWFK